MHGFTETTIQSFWLVGNWYEVTKLVQAESKLCHYILHVS
jgi:hypothetical protein